jgi:peptidoglycan/LPS O-acetylase OafA/YrhL
MELPNALEGNNETLASATLWTLRYEVLAYIGTAIAFALGFMRKKWMLLAQFVAFAIGWIVISGFGLLDAALTNGTPLLEVMTAILLAYFVFWAAYVKIPALNGLQSVSDISYGIYIYHWAIMQWLNHVFPTMGPWMLIAIGAPITIAISIASWRYVEKPILNSKKSFSEYLRFGRSKPRYDGATMLVD